MKYYYGEPIKLNEFILTKHSLQDQIEYIILTKYS
jgi:hypothetical protein